MRQIRQTWQIRQANWARGLTRRKAAARRQLARRIEPAEREHGGRALRENLLAKPIAYWRKPAPSHE